LPPTRMFSSGSNSSSSVLKRLKFLSTNRRIVPTSYCSHSEFGSAIPALCARDGARNRMNADPREHRHQQRAAHAVMLAASTRFADPRPLASSVSRTFGAPRAAQGKHLAQTNGKPYDTEYRTQTRTCRPVPAIQLKP
jgi:hypothetical protein